MGKAEYWHETDGGRAQCDLCPHHCVMSGGEVGLCRVRGVKGGVLDALCYGMVSSAQMDPIEKKPLYHFRPGSRILSIGGWGCNLSCEFCQNWSISQKVVVGSNAHTPAGVVKEARESESVGIAFTYNEPIVGFEFVRDCAVLAHEAGMVNVMVTNGHVAPEPGAELLGVVDALNIDVKSMDQQFYDKYCGGQLAAVLSFAKMAVGLGRHVEITNLVIPGLNDGQEQIESLARWIVDNLSDSIPLHLSAYRPEHRMNIEATSAELLMGAYETCKQFLQYVYVGNVFTDQGQNTCCPSCGATLVARHGYATETVGIKGRRCAKCGRNADMVIGA